MELPSPERPAKEPDELKTEAEPKLPIDELLEKEVADANREARESVSKAIPIRFFVLESDIKVFFEGFLGKEP